MAKDCPRKFRDKERERNFGAAFIKGEQLYGCDEQAECCDTRLNKYTKSEKNAPFEYVNKHEIMEKISPIIDNTLMRFGLIPVEVELVKENHKWFLRIYIYSLERDVNLDDCERVSRSLSDFLEELIPFKYFLEVSSPGLERKIKHEKEYLIFKGKDINLKLKEPVDKSGEKQFVAKIVDFDENEGLTVFTYKDKKDILIKKDNIVSAKLYFSEI